MGKYKKLGANTIIFTIGSFGQKVLTFLFVPYYTYILSTEEYGTADLITTTISLLFPVFTVIIGEAMMRFAFQQNEDKNQVLSVGISIWIKGFVIFLALSPILLLVPSLKNYYLLFVLYYIGYSLYSTILYFIRGIEKNIAVAAGGIINTLTAVILNVIFLSVLGLGVQGYLTSYIIANFVSLVFMFFSADLRKYKITLRPDKDLQHRMIRYSLPLMPNSVSWWISNSSDKYILAFFASVATTGIYSVAYKIPTIITTISSIFMSAWRISAFDEYDKDDASSFYSNVFQLYISATVLCASFLLVINKPLAHVLFSKDFYAAWQCVPLLLLAAVFHSYSDFYGSIFTASYKTNEILYSTLIGAIGNIILNFLLIPRWEAVGAAIATLLSYIIVFVIRLIQSRKLIAIKFNLVRDILTFVCVFAQMLVASLELDYEYLISILLFVIIAALRWESVQSFLKKGLQMIKNRSK